MRRILKEVADTIGLTLVSALIAGIALVGTGVVPAHADTITVSSAPESSAVFSKVPVPDTTVAAASATGSRPPCPQIRYTGTKKKPKVARLECRDGVEVSVSVKGLKWNKPKKVAATAGKGAHRHTILQVLKGHNKKGQTILAVWYDNGERDKKPDNFTSRNLMTQSPAGSFAR